MPRSTLSSIVRLPQLHRCPSGLWSRQGRRLATRLKHWARRQWRLWRLAPESGFVHCSYLWYGAPVWYQPAPCQTETTPGTSTEAFDHALDTRGCGPGMPLRLGERALDAIGQAQVLRVTVTIEAAAAFEASAQRGDFVIVAAEPYPNRVDLYIRRT